MSKWTKLDKVKGFVKRYDENLKIKYDDPIRKKLKDILGDVIIDNPDPYQQDFIITNKECAFKYLEVQVCANWVHTYPYDKLFIYSRKTKYDNDTLFLTVSKTLKEGYLFRMCDVVKKPRRLKKYSREFVNDIPWSEAMKVYIDYFDEETLLSIT